MTIELTDQDWRAAERWNDTYPDLDPSWERADLTRILTGSHVPTLPTVLRIEGGGALLYRGHVCGFHADSGVGKTYVAAVAIAEQLREGHHVVLVDLEEPDATTIVERLRGMGVSDRLIADQFHYYGPQEAFSDEAVAHLQADILEFEIPLVAIDSLGEAFGLEGIDENHDVEVGPWLRRVARRLADAGACVLLIDHATKAADNPLHPSGSKRKRAAITGASYLIEAPVPLTREQGGRLTLTCAKDRHGHYKRGQAVANVVFTVYPDDGMTVHVWPICEAQDGGDTRLMVVARAAVRAVKDLGTPASLRRLLESMPVKARRDLKIAGIEEAIARGAIRTEDGPRRAVMHVSVRELEETNG